MRKHINRSDRPLKQKEEKWLDIPKLAEIDVTSADHNFPIESAIRLGKKRGWRAASAGEQTIRIIFHRPQRLARILLVFEEHEIARSHQFVLRWCTDVREPYREIVRQQWNFSPPATVREIEDYSVELSNVKELELVVVPDMSGGEAIASLVQFRLG